MACAWGSMIGAAKTAPGGAVDGAACSSMSWKTSPIVLHTSSLPNYYIQTEWGGHRCVVCLREVTVCAWSFCCCLTNPAYDVRHAGISIECVAAASSFTVRCFCATPCSVTMGRQCRKRMRGSCQTESVRFLL